jgi:hypothetical protein
MSADRHDQFDRCSGQVFIHIENIDDAENDSDDPKSDADDAVDETEDI